MEDVPYVNQDALAKARELEDRLLILPPEAGILFIAVLALPVIGGASKEFDVRLGIARRFEAETGLAIIKKVFEEDLKDGSIKISAAVYRGIRGSGSDEDFKRPDQPAS